MSIKSKKWISDIKNKIADPLGLPVVFYEGGQHITPNPFGQDPTYEKCLLDIQRDTSMFNLYNEWFDFMETLNSGDVPLICMNFSFVSGRSAKYGSWGILETLDQDTTLIPAPKHSAILKYMAENCVSSSSNYDQHSDNSFIVFPNPATDWINIESKYDDILNCKIFSSQGHLIQKTNQQRLNIESLKPGIYYMQLTSDKKAETRKITISGN